MIQQGFPVIVSVQPGTFTTTGHLMVLALNREGGFKCLIQMIHQIKPLQKNFL